MTVQQVLTALQGWAEASVWLLVAAGMLAGAVGYRLLSSLWRNWRMQRRFQRGAAAEKKAARFLRRQGYRILAAQLAETVTVYVNGQPQKSTVRADFYVRKGWRTYIVEVKSGQQGTVRLPNVRRQLLEYKLVYRPHGILLLDMEHGVLEEIRFTYTDMRRRSCAGYGLACLLTGMLVYGLARFF